MSKQAHVAFTYGDFEQKWIDQWEKDGIYHAPDNSPKPKKYLLVEFPYPSGPGMHMGHCRNFTMFDVLARYYRAKGMNVMYPMGWDAMGLPTFNYAVKVNRSPQEVTAENVTNFKRQLKSLGLSFDWSREINTSDPKYYQWTQWIFIQFFNHWYDAEQQKPRPIDELPIPAEVQKKGALAVNEYQNEYRLAYKAKKPINWCPSCKIGLANEEVVDGKCERCGHEVEQREIEQWLLRITTYADRLADDLDLVDFPEWVKVSQRNWIGRSEGINIQYPIDGTDHELTVFTTRPDTNFGATFIVAAPDSSLVQKHLKDFPEQEKVQAYVRQAMQKTELDRVADGKKKTGVFTGWYAQNRLNDKKLPVYVGDFVLGSVGTGVVVGVPGHDIRDFEFAQAMGIEVIRVVKGKDGDESPITSPEQVQEEQGTMVNSDFLNGMDIHQATTKIMDFLEEKKWGQRVVNYKIRDWVFSRQHYWGEPVPIMYNEEKGYLAIPDEQLPVELPVMKDYNPTAEGDPPLARATEWRQVTLPDGTTGLREIDIMPNWAGSSWYFIRYIDPRNNERIADMDKMKHWLMVDHYEGGQEHVTLHLLYSRFWHKFLYDLGQVPTPEPYAKRTIHGVVLAEDGRKMSKSLGNVVVPDELVKTYGADITRLGVMFMGGYEDTFPWNTRAIDGVRRFANKWYQFMVEARQSAAEKPEKDVERRLNNLGYQIGQDVERLAFNSGIAKLMEFYNETKTQPFTSEQLNRLLIIAGIFMPFVAEELWHQAGHKESLHTQIWPSYDAALSEQAEATVVVQINGKVRGRVLVATGASQEEVVAAVSETPWYAEHVGDKEPHKVIFVPNKLLNVVV